MGAVMAALDWLETVHASDTLFHPAFRTLALARGLRRARDSWRDECQLLRTLMARRLDEITKLWADLEFVESENEALAMSRQAANDALTTALRERDEAREVLREVEWSGTTWCMHDQLPACPCCEMRPKMGHKSDCALAAAIGKGTK
jgi:uncharacterized membrane protein